jgi:hypothetical protein
MNKYGCCRVHHATKICKFKKELTKMVNVYSLLVLVREEEENPYSRGTPPTIYIITTATMNQFMPSSDYRKKQKNKKVKKTHQKEF